MATVDIITLHFQDPPFDRFIKDPARCPFHWESPGFAKRLASFVDFPGNAVPLSDVPDALKVLHAVWEHDFADDSEKMRVRSAQQLVTPVMRSVKNQVIYKHEVFAQIKNWVEVLMDTEMRKKYPDVYKTLFGFDGFMANYVTMERQHIASAIQSLSKKPDPASFLVGLVLWYIYTLHPIDAHGYIQARKDVIESLITTNVWTTNES